MSTEEKVKSDRTKILELLVKIGVPMENARTIVRDAINYRDTVNKLSTMETVEERVNALLDLSDAAIRNALVSVFSAADKGMKVPQEEVAEVALSTLVTHASHGCLMITKSVESAMELFDDLCTTAFQTSMEAQAQSKESVEKILEMSKILMEKKNAPVH